MIQIEKISRSQGKETVINEFITDKYVYVEANGRDVIFLEDKNLSFSVVHDEKSLHSIDTTSIQKQINRIKTLLPDLTEEKYKLKEGGETQIKLEGRNKDAVVVTSVCAKKVMALESTCYHKFLEYNKQCSLLSIDLERDEIISSVELNLNFFEYPFLHLTACYCCYHQSVK